MAQTILIQAPAKLNLALSIGAVNPQGMHPISSWMVTADLFDDLYLETLPPASFSLFATIWHKDALRRSDIDWSISKDLVHRAHGQLEKFVGRELPVKSRLEKRIPVGGGLGGGSSDAAAMLRGLNELYSLKVSADDLRAIASTLGSDVPFLIDGGSAIIGGIGEKIESLGAPPELHAVFFFPEVPCPTGAVYKQFDTLSNSASSPARLRESKVRSLAMQSSVLPTDPFNDLAEAAGIIAPAMSDDMEEIAQLAQLPIHVCGSGSSLFTLCTDPMHASALAEASSTRLHIPAVAIQTTPLPPMIPNPLHVRQI